MPDATETLRRPQSSNWSLVALAAGLSLGWIGHALGGSGFQVVADVLQPVGEMWIAVLLALVLPLVISYTLAAAVGMPRDQSAGALGVRAILLFVVLLAAGGLFTVAVGFPFVSLFPVDPSAAAALKAGTAVPDAVREAALATSNSGSSLVDWFTGLFPRNLFEAARQGQLLPLLLFALLVGMAVTRLPDEHREPMTRIIRAFAATMMTCIRWLLWFMPAGVFIFTYLFVLGTGGLAAGILAGFVIVVSLILLAWAGAFYPITALFGRVTLRQFARAVAPAQLIGVSTRSSLASLPALVEAGQTRLRLPESATGFVLPLAAALFKPNRTVSSTAKLLFLAHVFGVPLSAGTIAAFLVSVMVLSFSTIGLPGGASAFKTLPAYVAAGIPVEALVITEAVEAIPDVFKTLVNVTANMSVAALLSRSSRPAFALAPVAAGQEPAPEARVFASARLELPR